MLFAVEALEPYPSLALALIIGMLIGLEREHARGQVEGPHGSPGGVRTFPLIALLGALSVLLVPTIGPWAFVASLVALAALLAVGYVRDSQAGNAGLTSEVSALLTFALGALASAEQAIGSLERRAFVVASVGVVAMFLLSKKTELRAFSSKLVKDDVIAATKFLLVAVVVMPLLPDEPRGPYGALNPYRTGFMVVLISGISFVGYVAMRLWGHGRGMLVSGAVGGLVSSTAVTLAAASRAKASPALGPVSALAAIVASTIMAVRVLVAAAIVEPSLLSHLALGLGTMICLGVGWVTFFALQKPAQPADGAVSVSNPFELTSSLKFAAIYVAVLIASRWAFETFGTRGAYLTGVLAGVSDVDGITLSMSNLVKSGQMSARIAGQTIIFAACSNTAAKAGLALVLGGGVFGRRVLLALGTMLASALAVSLLA